MLPRVISVKPVNNYNLLITFTTGEERIFDVKAYLDKGIFRELIDVEKFNTVRPFLGSIIWEGGQDFCPDMLYEESVIIST